MPTRYLVNFCAHSTYYTTIYCPSRKHSDLNTLKMRENERGGEGERERESSTYVVWKLSSLPPLPPPLLPVTCGVVWCGPDQVWCNLPGPPTRACPGYSVHEFLCITRDLHVYLAWPRARLLPPILPSSRISLCSKHVSATKAIHNVCIPAFINILCHLCRSYWLRASAWLYVRVLLIKTNIQINTYARTHTDTNKQTQT